MLKAHDPHGYLDKDEGLQKAIADKLMALAELWRDRPTRTAPQNARKLRFQAAALVVAMP